MNYNKANIFLHELQQVKEDFLRPFKKNVIYYMSIFLTSRLQKLSTTVNWAAEKIPNKQWKK